MEKLREYAQRYNISLSEEMLAQFAEYEHFLLEYNEKVNLTAIIDHESVLQKHFLDSILPLNAYGIPQSAGVIDVGTGAGFPGVPIKIVRPDIKLTLLDSLQKRVTFLEQLSERLGIESTAVHARAEEAAHKPECREQYDIAFSRAVAALPVLCEYTLGYVKPGGVLLALKGKSAGDEAERAQHAIAELGAELEAVKNYRLPDGDERSILVIRKISQISGKYPRKAAKITKTPL